MEEFNPADLTDLAQRWFEAFNRHDVEGVVALHIKDAQHFSPKLRAQRPETGGMIRGSEQLREWWRDAFDRLPSLQYELRTVTAQGDRVFVEYVRHADGAEDMNVAEFYEVARVAGQIRIKVSRVYHG